MRLTQSKHSVMQNSGHIFILIKKNLTIFLWGWLLCILPLSYRRGNWSRDGWSHLSKVTQPGSGRAVWLQSLSIWCRWVLNGAGGYTVSTAYSVLGTRRKHSIAQGFNSLSWLSPHGPGDAKPIFMIERREVREIKWRLGDNHCWEGLAPGPAPHSFSLHAAGQCPGPFRAAWGRVVTSHKGPQDASRLPGDTWVEAHVSWLQPIVFCFCSWYYNNNISGHCK